MKLTALVSALAFALAPIVASAQSATPQPAPVEQQETTPLEGGVSNGAPLVGLFGLQGAGIVAVSGLVIVTGAIVGIAVGQDSDDPATVTTTTTTTTN